MFVGRYERQLDPKGRLALPSAYRPKFEPRCYLALGKDGCIDVFTPEAFDEMANDTIEKVRRGEMTRAEQRTLSSRTFEVNVDAQGRVNIAQELRDFAHLDLNSPVIVAGSFDRVEIWNPAEYEEMSAEGGASIKGA